MAREQDPITTESHDQGESDELYLEPPTRRHGTWIFLLVILLAAAVAVGLLMAGVT